MTIGLVVAFAGYTIGSYGWVLLKGYDITFKEWINPLNPYTWPASGAPQPIGAGRVFPGG